MELVKVVQKLNKNDAEICKALKSVVLQGKYEINGAALAKAGALFQWLDQLDARIIETLKDPQETIRKEVGHSPPAKKGK